ncbi:Rho-binding antiterminator [uncultured Shewanella sp.]|uniref:Rho-binding antiterminator n=1 Tax=uncultured Shewanella sp. TaxID=173975 RepID=UPI00262959BA|nr:Rho-binding antiterminator [uncultured Shewanella sp.]
MLRCDLHDYLEIMCLYQYQVELTMLDNSVINGQFFDTGFTEISGKKKEIIKGAINDNGSPLFVEVAQIKSVKVLTPNPVFSDIDFTNA